MYIVLLRMYLRVPLYKYKLCSTNKYLRTSICSVTPTGDRNKYKFSISTSMFISLLYEFMKNSYICYCYMSTVSEYQCMCTCISHMFPTKR